MVFLNSPCRETPKNVLKKKVKKKKSRMVGGSEIYQMYGGVRRFLFWRPLEKKRRTPRAIAKAQTHPPAIGLGFLDFFGARLWACLGLGKGSSKTPQKCFYKTFSKKIVQNFVVRFSSIFFCSIAFPGVF
jgi:hypothetical protein